MLFADNLTSFAPPRPGDDGIAVVDIGSNSVRMVVFEGGRRCPAMIFNEKVLCGLGAELGETGRLAPAGRERALAAIHRFMALAPGLRVGSLVGVATAALREAEDGAAFGEQIRSETRLNVQIISGEDEARLAAQGVLFGDPDASGLVIDLGGASMEVCPIADGVPLAGVTTPLGPQRLAAAAGDRAAMREMMDQALTPLVRDFQDHSHRLNLVGGAWRALGRVQLHLSGHPLTILHEYEMSADEAHDLALWTGQADRTVLADIPGVPSGRVGTLPQAAILLGALLDHFGPKDLKISGFGLREGVCYDYLSDRIRRQNPLISTCKGQETTRARAPGFGAELGDWLMSVMAPADTTEERLIRAVCHLVDVSWRAHPDYRTTSCVEVVTRANVSSAGHVGRAFMAAALLTRYKGGRKALSNSAFVELLPSETLDRAIRLGALMRLGATIAGTTPGFLERCPIRLGEQLTLAPDQTGRQFLGEEVDKRLAQAARSFGVAPEIATPT